MKHLLVTSLMIVTVALFIVGRVTGYLRLDEMNPVSLFGLKLVLFVVSAGFFGVSMVKLIHLIIDYQPNPLNIAIYLGGLVVAAIAAWMTTERLTRE